VIFCLDTEFDKITSSIAGSSDSFAGIRITNPLPQISRSFYTLLDEKNNILLFPEQIDLPYNYSSIFQAHLVPHFGIKNKAKLDEMIFNTSNDKLSTITIRLFGVKRDLKVAAYKINIGIKDNGQSASLVSIWYFYEKQDEDKQKKVLELVQTSRTEINYLTVLMILLMSGIIFCISSM